MTTDDAEHYNMRTSTTDCANEQSSTKCSHRHIIAPTRLHSGYAVCADVLLVVTWFAPVT